MKYFFLIFSILILTQCSLNKVILHHGVHNLEKKQAKLKINYTNKNDIIKEMKKDSRKVILSGFDGDSAITHGEQFLFELLHKYKFKDFFKQLKLKIGDEIYVGNKMFEISGIVLYEPDRGINFVNFAPRVFINYESLPETGLIQVGSRVSYRMWLATDKTERLDDFDKLESSLILQIDPKTSKIKKNELNNYVS